MTSKSLSPGGSLLRSSRVFAIPSPLPRAINALSGFGSDTQTTPYPLHATITTPQAALKRGDWGFKRPLPLRSTTKSSTPFIRVEAIDTIEHVTEYRSAADHTLNLQKWLEMDVAIHTPQKRSIADMGVSFAEPKSVFEDDIDQIAPREDGSKTKKEVRWKFNGPWLAGQTEGQFNTYLEKVVGKRKVEFQEFLRKACAQAQSKRRQTSAREKGKTTPSPVSSEKVTDAQLREYIVSLRADRAELYGQVRKFLDIPPSATMSINASDVFFREGNERQFMEATLPVVEDSPYAHSGPPKTHPSAGLSYSRTSAHLTNHPLYGPQDSKAPVQSRVVMPKGASTGSFAPVLGVGGFVVDVPRGNTSFNLQGRFSRNSTQQVEGLAQIEPHKVGGSKAYVQPKGAHVDSAGKVILTVEAAKPEAVSVLEGKVDEIPEPHLYSQLQRPTGFAKPLTQSNEGYGLQGFGNASATVLGDGASGRPSAFGDLGQQLFNNRN
ncbi:hypothetical protein PVAG01_08242 [Phlyctema vagabunda]|uniref:Mitochondrial ribosomal protein MRP51 n=1 Tax=Phlyctema vagabunda TaxID=108571 RepID=A0ABR4P8X8_9HELO